jgi:hypothetical protein
MRAYLLDVGILLTEKDTEFESYNTVYDKKYGYYDEGQCYIATEDEAIKQAKQYVVDGVENTYAVVSNTTLDDDIDINDDELCVEDEEYITDNIVYSVAKINGKIVENFIQ